MTIFKELLLELKNKDEQVRNLMSTFYADLKRICETEKLGNRKLCAKIKTTCIPMNVFHRITSQLNGRDDKKYEEKSKTNFEETR